MMKTSRKCISVLWSIILCLPKSSSTSRGRPAHSVLHLAKHQSSGAYLIHTALQLQDGDNLERAVDAPECLTSRPNLLLWEKYMESQRQLQDTSSYDFPQLDLISSLVDLYFTHINSFLPLLHRPTFDRGVEEKFHLTDNSFGGVLLLVCALGARFSDDPRVIPDVKNGISSAGMQWYSQVHVMKAPAVRKATLYDLQLYPVSLSAPFIHRTASSMMRLSLVVSHISASGLCCPINVGRYHRRSAYGARSWGP